jgi:hypothetical protein
MAMAFDSKPKDDRSRVNEWASASDLLEKAHALAGEIEQLLTEVGHEAGESNAFRVRLARAHTLSLLDQLAELLGTRSSGYGPGVHGCPPARDEDGEATSGVRRAPIWR